MTAPAGEVLEQVTGDPPAASRGEIRAFAACRNERLRLPAFLKHYRELGVSRFLIVDNESTDGTTEYLAAQPDVHLFRTASRYSEAGMGIDWVNTLLARFGVDVWCVTVDIDELLLYPGSERAPLADFTKYLDANGADACACMLLDMYPGGRLKDSAYAAGDDIVGAAPCFDPGPYQRVSVERCPGILIRGGMRERIFYPEFRARGVGAKLFDAMLYRGALRTPLIRDIEWVRALRRPTPPCLTKVPLVRWDATSKYLQSTHWISPKSVAPETGVLLHMKFLHDFHARALQEVARSEHYDGASEYRRYARRLDENPQLTLAFDGSTRFKGTAQLVELGLMHDSSEWAAVRDRRQS